MTPTTPPPLTGGLTWLLAIACGVFVSGIYFNQPLLADFANEFHTSIQSIATVAAATQIGYALGLLLFAPLGDRYEKRALISVLAPLLALSLIAVAAARTLPALIAASFALGLFATVTQQLLPIAAHLADPERRGRTVGTVMSGLLLGILCGRFFAGTVSALWGWRSVFLIEAALVLVLAAALRFALPRMPGEHRASYPRLIASVFGVARQYAPLREAALIAGLLFAGFSVFWVTLTPLLATAFHLGGGVAGLFGLVGAVGAAAAPIAGRYADRYGSRWVLNASILIVFASFIVFALGSGSLILLALGTILLDLGAQATHIANQTRIFALDVAARARINAFYMTSFFIGGSVGSALAGTAWQYGGWMAAMMLGGAFTLLAALVHVFAGRAARASRS
jgi:predicted MFS family arabinose efflux permease